MKINFLKSVLLKNYIGSQKLFTLLHIWTINFQKTYWIFRSFINIKLLYLGSLLKSLNCFLYFFWWSISETAAFRKYVSLPWNPISFNNNMQNICLKCSKNSIVFQFSKSIILIIYMKLHTTQIEAVSWCFFKNIYRHFILG